MVQRQRGAMAAGAVVAVVAVVAVAAVVAVVAVVAVEAVVAVAAVVAVVAVEAVVAVVAVAAWWWRAAPCAHLHQGVELVGDAGGGEADQLLQAGHRREVHAGQQRLLEQRVPASRRRHGMQSATGRSHTAASQPSRAWCGSTGEPARPPEAMRVSGPASASSGKGGGEEGRRWAAAAEEGGRQDAR
eukprot:COSAG01_NODE_705_length_14144_cov_66.242862_21_plen_187_part_00